jgi:hypothetical protein
LFFFYPGFFPVDLSICNASDENLPDRVANVATYSLLGVEPIETVIDKLILIFFGSILQNKDTIEYRIIERQISMDKPNGKSFALFSRLGASFQKVGVVSLGISKLTDCFSSIQASSQ